MYSLDLTDKPLVASRIGDLVHYLTFDVQRTLFDQLAGDHAGTERGQSRRFVPVPFFPAGD